MEDILKNYEDKPLPFGQLLIEIHAYQDRFPNSMKLVNWFSALENAGLRPFMFEPNLVYANYNRGGPPQLCEVSRWASPSRQTQLGHHADALLLSLQYSFINVKGNHNLITG